MSVSADKIAANSKDHGVRDAGALLVVAHVAAAILHPPEGAPLRAAAGTVKPFKLHQHRTEGGVSPAALSRARSSVPSCRG